MWRTSHGDRVLLDEERSIFLEAVGYLRDMITVAAEIQDPFQVGVSAFDSLQPTQQLVALHTVAKALVEVNTEPPPLSATLEAAIYATYRSLASLVEMEIDSTTQTSGQYEIREGILAALKAPVVTEEGQNDFNDFKISDDADVLPTPQTTEMDEWDFAIEMLADRILWDRDFELDDLLADKDPNETTEIKEFLGIDEDYFAIAAPDVLSDEFRKIDNELIALRKRFIPGEP